MLEKENKNSRHIIFMKNKYEKIKKKNLKRALRKKNQAQNKLRHAN
jgi:hypothetical protein